MMIDLKRICFLVALWLVSLGAFAQSADRPEFILSVVNEKAQPVQGATVELRQAGNLIKTTTTDNKGEAPFGSISNGDYVFAVSYAGYKKKSKSYHFPSEVNRDSVILQPAVTTLQEVNISSRKAFIQQKQGKTIVNVDASVTNVGTTVLEVLEKSPGVTVDKNGGISMKGKAGVLVMIDDKPTYLSGDDLNNLLSSMSSSQVDQIELMPNPPAKYDASGNAGVINIKTKKNKQKGFNGTFTTSVGQGVYPKNSNNLALNYRNGKINTFFNYNVNLVKYLTDLYALRKYYDANGELTSQLRQPAYFKGNFVNNTVKTGLDYYVNPKTTIGIILGATAIQRNGNNNGQASWLSPSGTVDSAINTANKSDTRFRNGSVNVNATHHITETQDVTLNADLLHYSINTSESFNNQLLAPNGYQQLSRGDIPTTINILSAKADYTLKIGKNNTLSAGAKTSHSSTDNIASYQNFDGSQWVEDNTKNNHFTYRENIHAIYSQFDGRSGDWSAQAGLRYEYTNYSAEQLGNAIQPDSAFSRNYGGLFPSGNISYQADSSNSFTFTMGRRIDRPIFQNLNPFYFIINKYTYQTGNPFLLPQYSWNLELSHQYKNMLTTAVSYSIITNYFSQIFLADTAKGVLLYGQGNVGRTNNFGLSETLVISPFNWWSLTAQAVYNYKQLIGFNGNNYKSYVNQLNVSTTSQFTIGKMYTAEIGGNYTSHARNDIQEYLYPTGQLSLGVSRPIMKKKATLRLTARDIFYTNAMEGLTQFPNATEYFKLKRDSRVVTLAFIYRFGKAYKTTKRSEGSATDEADRVGNG